MAIVGVKQQENQSVIQKNHKRRGRCSTVAKKNQRRGDCQPQQAFDEEKQKTDYAQFSQTLQPRGVPGLRSDGGG